MRNYPWLNLFQISEKRRLLFAYDMFRLLERNVTNQFLLLLPEITLHGYTCIYGKCYLLTNTYSLFSRKSSRSGSTVSTVFSLSDIFFLTVETLTFVQFSSWYIIFVPTYDLSQAAFPSLWRFFLRFQNICSNFRRTFEKLILVLPHLPDLVHRIK